MSTTRDTLCAVQFASFGRTGPRRREISAKCLSQGYNDEPPDSNTEPATFRLSAGALQTELRRRKDQLHYRTCTLHAAKLNEHFLKYSMQICLFVVNIVC